jgi:hypothetical protein
MRGHTKAALERKRAREMGVTVKAMREVEDRLRAMPMELFLDRVFGPGKAVYEPETDLWLVPDPQHKGPGFGFIAIRQDKSFFLGVVQYGTLQ